MSGLRIDNDVAVPMRDGVVLRADVWRPADYEPRPALVLRTPYDKNQEWSGFHRLHQLAAAGYAVVVQDTRGRFASGGEWRGLTMWDLEADDTYDTVEWAAAQPWCDSGVALFGASYSGALCWLGAMARPPHLRAIVPELTGDRDTEHLDTGGAFWLHTWISWYLAAIGDPADPPPIVERLDGIDRPGMPVTLADVLSGAAAGMPRTFDATRVAVPALLVGGWYDFYAARTVDQFRRLRTLSAPEVRDEHRLIMGPWTHDSAGPVQGELNLGAAANGLGVVQPAMLAFLDRHLKQGAGDLPPVRYFVPGDTRWHDAESWPPAGTEPRDWYLHAGGALSRSVPVLDEPPDHYRYDPADPVRTLGGRVGGNIAASGPAGPRDQRVLAERADVLRYETPVLPDPVVVEGPVTVHVHAATSTVDTDFAARLVDVHPDGRLLLVTAGLARARHRKGTDRDVPVEPGAVEEYEIGLGPVAHRFARGHRIGLLICSSDFPWFDRNTNTGEPFGATSVVADQTILHDPAHPSRLETHIRTTR